MQIVSAKTPREKSACFLHWERRSRRARIALRGTQGRCSARSRRERRAAARGADGANLSPNPQQTEIAASSCKGIRKGLGATVLLTSWKRRELRGGLCWPRLLGARSQTARCERRSAQGRMHLTQQSSRLLEPRFSLSPHSPYHPSPSTPFPPTPPTPQPHTSRRAGSPSPTPLVGPHPMGDGHGSISRPREELGEIWCLAANGRSGGIGGGGGRGVLWAPSLHPSPTTPPLCHHRHPPRTQSTAMS